MMNERRQILSGISHFIISLLYLFSPNLYRLHPLLNPASFLAGRAPPCGGVARPRSTRHAKAPLLLQAQPPHDGALPAYR
jgi:hypothetical protein